jgi:CrcB protein
MDSPFLSVLLVGLGGFLGAIARYALSARLSQRFPRSIPYGTLTVNLVGSFWIGWLWGHPVLELDLLLWGTGFMGAFTTFSTFKVELVDLMKAHKWRSSIIYMGLSYAVGVMLAYIGYTS